MHPLSGSLGSIPAWGSKIPQVLWFSLHPPQKRCCALRICLFLPIHHCDPQRLCLDSYNSFLIAYKATALKPLHLNLNTVAKWLFKTVRLSHPLLNNFDIATGSEKSYTNFTDSLMTIQSPPCHLPTPWLSSLTAVAPSPLCTLGAALPRGLCTCCCHVQGSSRDGHGLTLSPLSCLCSTSIFSVRLSPPNALHTPQPFPALSHGIYRDLTYKISRLFFILSLPTNRQN